MKNLRTYLFIGFNLFFLLNTWHVQSCAYWEPDWEMYRFFDPELDQTNRFKPLYFSFKRFYTDSPAPEVDENLVEWQNYVHNNASQKDLSELIYKSTQQDWDKIRGFVLLQKPLKDTKWAANSAVKYWATQKDAEAIEYLMFAKQCERYTYKEDVWEEPQPNQREMLLSLSKDAEKRFQMAKNPFIKLRYGYQTVRAAHYAKDYKRTILLYDNLIEPLKSENIVKYWALGHKAGALKSMGQHAMAAYLFGVVFEKSSSKRVQAFLSCKIVTEEDWKKAISYCKNNKEKSTLFCIRGIHPQNLALPEMMAIFSLDADSDYLDMLLMREINKIEMALMPSKMGQEEQGNASSDQIALFKNYVPKLKSFISKYLKVKHPENKQSLWIMALGYCDYLMGSPSESRKSLAQLDQAALEPQAKKQYEVVMTMIELMEVNILDAQTEEKLYQKVQYSKNLALKGLMVASFNEHYRKAGEKAKNILSYGGLASAQSDFATVDDLLAFVEKENKTAYEKELQDKIDTKNPKKVLLEVKATQMLAEGNYEEAEKLLKIAGIHTAFQGDPASDELIDCVHCKRSKTFTKISLIQQIRALELQAKKGVAEANLKLGNIFYNITYFGHAWKAQAYNRSGTDLNVYNLKNKNVYVFNTQKAHEHYQKAIEAYEKAGNKEMAAKAMFLAAKTEQNDLFLSEDFRKADFFAEGMKPYFVAEYRTHFKELKEKYRATQFYKRALKECRYLTAYSY